MNLQNYVDRIEYDGPLNTDASTLKELMSCHGRTVPYEYFDLLGGEDKVLSLEKIYNDIVVKNRGGFCYENNALFCWLLRKIGFEVLMLQAQSYLPCGGGRFAFGPEFDHMTLLVTCSKGDRWIADVGTSLRTFALPLKFIEMETQIMESGVYRVRRMDENDDHTYLIEKLPKRVIKGRKRAKDLTKWKYVYKFTLTPRKLAEFENQSNVLHGDTSFFRTNAVSSILTRGGVTMSWGMAFCKKKYIDPYTEEVADVIVAKNEAEFKEMIKTEMGVVIDFPLFLRDDDFEGWTDDWHEDYIHEKIPVLGTEIISLVSCNENDK